MRRQFRNFDWLVFFNTIFEEIRDKDGKIIRFDEDTEVVIYGVDFVERFDKLLPQFDKKIVFNYLSWCWFFKVGSIL